MWSDSAAGCRNKQGLLPGSTQPAAAQSRRRCNLLVCTDALADLPLSFASRTRTRFQEA